MSTFHEEPLARGRTADIYPWGERHVLKLFHTWFELENIEYEQKIARAVLASGVRSPAVGEIIDVEGRNGLLYERISGESMLDLTLRRPWNVFTYARTLAQLHAEMHDRVFDAEIPEQRDRLRNKISHAGALSGSLKRSLLETMEHLPTGDRVCHGDFHPANVLVAGREVTVIDWIDASRGSPLADVARTSILLRGAAASGQISNPFIRMFVRVFHAAYLRHYFRLRPGGEAEFRRWLPIVAGARLSENIPELEPWLLLQAGSSPASQGSEQG